MPRIIIKYSKSYNNINNLKKNFYTNNKENLKSAININKLYKKNPIRVFCINCQKKSLRKFIKSHLIEYYVCTSCLHLNGKYKETEKFLKQLYSDNSGNNYKKNYLKDYEQRVKNIYIPKVNFLKTVINQKINLLDLGAGGGHFLKALEIKKIKARGVEPSKALSELGNLKLKKNKISNLSLSATYKILETQRDCNTISLIGVLEHLIDPNLMIKSFLKSNAKFLYISVPLLSLSVFLENSFQNVYPRQLSGAHTNLFTKDSLYKMAKRYNLKIIGEWWFGTDFADMNRSLLVSNNAINKKNYLKDLHSKFYNFIDELQSVLDKNKICSEVHMVFEKKNYE